MTNPEPHPLAAKQGRCGLADACIVLDDCEKAKPLLLNVVQSDPDDTCVLVPWPLSAPSPELQSPPGQRLPRAFRVQQATNYKNLRVPCLTQIKQKETMKTNKTKPPSPTTPHTARKSLRRLSALTRQLTAQGKFEDAAVAIERLFAIAAPRDERSERLLDKARQSYFACQRALARQNQPAAAQAAAELLAETEKLAGYPIRVAVEDDADLPDGSGVNFAWERGCGQHLVLCRREPQELQPYELAAALVRIGEPTSRASPASAGSKSASCSPCSTPWRRSASRLREGSG